ncbi:MAG TPA: class I SAM-dependent methyltransferase [Myxococcota bacterium]|nr:class I SAM-dependent methyltransferase [Myxococcota bacterium]
MHEPPCRFCRAPLRDSFVDLGMSPLCQRHLRPDQLGEMEPFYPLHAYVCRACFLVQIEEVVPPEEIFGDGSYAYFSSFADSWLRHAAQYVELVTERFGLGPKNLVVEVASNDGYLLQNFVERGIPVLGIEPASNTAEAAVRKGVPTLVRFFGAETARAVARDHGRASLLLGNNVLAHVPDINDFVSGLALLLAPDGVLTMEFPHLMQLVEQNQFDTIYHEHFSYLSFGTVAAIFARHGLEMFDVEELGTHGGSLRVYARHAGRALSAKSPRVAALLAGEESRGMRGLEYYARFGEQVKETKRKLLAFLIEAKRAGKSICGYGAPGKGNTLLNYCGVRTDFLDYTVDRSPHKQGGFLPGTHIPIRAPEEIARTKPDYVLILPWNLQDEIMEQMAIVRSWGGKFVIPIPEVRVR